MRAHPAGPRHAELVSDSLPAAPPADLNALAQHVWPIGLKRAASGELVLNGRDVPSLVRESGTPVFLLDEADFRSRARAYAMAFAGCRHLLCKQGLQQHRVALVGRQGRTRSRRRNWR